MCEDLLVSSWFKNGPVYIGQVLKDPKDNCTIRVVRASSGSD